MGPMSLRRAVSLFALIAVVLGAAIGLSHVGRADVVGACNNRAWNVVVGHAPDQASVATVNIRVGHLVHSDCFAAAPDPAGGYNAVAQFSSAADAQRFLQKLVSAGYTRLWHVRPVLEKS